jgi:hypothetical protein
MKKRFRKLKRRRNAAPGQTGPIRRRRLRLPRRGSPPDWRTTLAALAGGAGGAALGGLVVNQQILSPEAVGIGMMGIGGATAYFADGNTRVLGNSVAAAGAGQLALALMARRAIATDRAAAGAMPPQPAPAPEPPRIGPAAPAPPPAGTPRKSATGGGVVVDLFRDAALELDQLDEDEWRFGTRDAEAPGGVDVYDLDLDLDDAA